MTTTTTFESPDAPQPQPPAASPAERLQTRFEGLRRAVTLGAGSIDDELIRDGRALLERYDARMRLSGEHTVVALVGGTGSGKSSLFNAIAGAELSQAGVIRPLTAAPHACVWGLAGAGPLLDWLGIDNRHRYARTGAPDTDRSLQGLVLLDLPDHDSVRAQETAEVSRLVGVADLLVFVLDPQKYADAAVHWRYLTKMTDHTNVSVLVLNQVDRLAEGEAEDCLTDLGRILDSEGVEPPRLLTTSAATGAGVGELRELLSDTVERRRAAADRLSADLDTLLRRFEPYTRVPPGDGLDRTRIIALIDALTEAAGVAAVGDALTTAHELRSVDYVGWPFAKLGTRFRSDPLRRMRLGELREELRDAYAGPVGAQQSEIDTAIRTATDDMADDLPEPWPGRVRAAAYRRSAELPDAIAGAMAEVVPNTEKAPGWWWLARLTQWLLVLAVLAGLVWMGGLVAYAVVGVAKPPHPLLANAGYIPYVGLMVLGVLGLGWLLSTGCRNLVLASADRRREQMEDDLRDQVAAVAKERVVAEVDGELRRYGEFRAAYVTAVGD